MPADSPHFKARSESLICLFCGHYEDAVPRLRWISRQVPTSFSEDRTGSVAGAERAEALPCIQKIAFLVKRESFVILPHDLLKVFRAQLVSHFDQFQRSTLAFHNDAIDDARFGLLAETVIYFTRR